MAKDNAVVGVAMVPSFAKALSKGCLVKSSWAMFYCLSWYE
jgi:hypothetical protein